MNYENAYAAAPFGECSEEIAFLALLEIYLEAGLPDILAMKSAAADCRDLFCDQGLSCAA